MKEADDGVEKEKSGLNIRKFVKIVLRYDIMIRDGYDLRWVS